MSCHTTQSPGRPVVTDPGHPGSSRRTAVRTRPGRNVVTPANPGDPGNSRRTAVRTRPGPNAVAPANPGDPGNSRRTTARRRTISLAALLCATIAAGCADSEAYRRPGEHEREAVADTLKQLVADAYDFSRPGVVARLMALYPDSGPVISAAAGSITTSRDTLEQGIRAFWENIGRHMQNPAWVWGETHVDVLGRNAAVMTAAYTIPHIAADGRPHTVGGVWTAVFVRTGGSWRIIQEHLSDREIPRPPE